MLLFAAAGRTDPNAQGVEEKTRMAEELYNRGYMVSLLGHYEQAIFLFKMSLEIQPTAEAYTYMGWTYSHIGDYQRAISEAEEAIRIDPDFGNPYNDIGVYLIELGRDDEAVQEFDKSLAIDPKYLPAKEALELLEIAGIRGI
jgi:tetratricopeptide (TPR) repeat protein